MVGELIRASGLEAPNRTWADDCSWLQLRGSLTDLYADLYNFFLLCTRIKTRMGLFGKSTVKAHGGAHEDAAREEAAREEAAREEAARKAKFQADEDELKELPFADYTNVFHRASARSQANSVHYGMTRNQLKGKDTIEQIKTKIKSVKDELHARCKENDVYAYETHFIRNYLLEQNPVYVVEALIC